MGETGRMGDAVLSGGDVKYIVCVLSPLPGTRWHHNPSTIFYDTRINTENGRSNKQL